MCVVLSSAFIKGLTASLQPAEPAYKDKSSMRLGWQHLVQFTVYSHSANMPGVGDTAAYDVKAKALVELVVSLGEAIPWR